MNKIFHLLILGLLSLPISVVAEIYRATQQSLPQKNQGFLAADATGISQRGSSPEHAVIKSITRDAFDTTRTCPRFGVDYKSTKQARTHCSSHINENSRVRF